MVKGCLLLLLVFGPAVGAGRQGPSGSSWVYQVQQTLVSSNESASLSQGRSAADLLKADLLASICFEVIHLLIGGLMGVGRPMPYGSPAFLATRQQLRREQAGGIWKELVRNGWKQVPAAWGPDSEP